MTKEALEERLKLLQNDLQVLQNNFYAAKGAIQDCEYWLSVLNTSESRTNNVGT